MFLRCLALIVVAAGTLLTPSLLPADDLAPLSDEFDSNSTLSNWSRVHATEGWNADQLAVLNFNTSATGQATLVPHTSTWYNNFRGELTYKNITGDFVASTRVRATNRAATAAPSRDYSLAGILVRTPRAITPGTWTAGGENYLFLSLGAANVSNSFQYEVKTTLNSNSVLEISSAGTSVTQIQVARIGHSFVMLRRADGDTTWTVHRRYFRSDMPATLQVGMTVYTDWDNVSAVDPFVHNSTVNTGGNPDLRAQFDYYRFRRPNVPAPLVGVNLTNPLVTDAILLSFLGDVAVPVTLREFSLEE
jgi:hypothetical protein